MKKTFELKITNNGSCISSIVRVMGFDFESRITTWIKLNFPADFSGRIGGEYVYTTTGDFTWWYGKNT